MKIYNNKVARALSIYNKQGINKKGRVKSNNNLKKDSVELSGRAKDFQVAMEALKNVPDVRQDKVDEIKKQISSGTYVVDSGKIVEKIFESITIDKKV